jgi:NDP-sugar pyrophosphorylase family protein
MQAILMAAGKGTRLRPLTLTTPKPLINVGGKPILQRSFESLPDQVNEVLVVVNYLADQIKSYFGDSYAGRSVRYVEQTGMRGTAGAAFACREYVTGGSFLVLNGDDLYSKKDLTQLVKHERAILVLERPAPGHFGICTLKSDGSFSGTCTPEEATAPFLINTGAYVLDKDFFSYPPVDIGNGEFGLPHTLALQARQHHVALEHASFWQPVGTHQELAAAQALLV